MKLIYLQKKKISFRFQVRERIWQLKKKKQKKVKAKIQGLG